MLFTLERLIGWPTLQVVLEHFWMQPGATGSDFPALLDQVSGRGLRSFVTAALDERTGFDYAVSELTSRSSGDAAHPYETAVTITRDAGAMPGIELAVSFADGAEARERWDGEDTSHTFRFASRAPARAARIDPGMVLLLDRNRANNLRALERPTSPLTVRATLRWVVWLQNLMISYAGLT
jgi:hypothetical protein